MSVAIMRWTNSLAHCLRDGVAGNDGIVVLTSRGFRRDGTETSVIGASVIVSVSAPTALAVRVANEAGITLAAVARADGFEVFTRGDGFHQISFFNARPRAMPTGSIANLSGMTMCYSASVAKRPGHEAPAEGQNNSRLELAYSVDSPDQFQYSPSLLLRA